MSRWQTANGGASLEEPQLGTALSRCQSNGDYVTHTHLPLKHELAFGPPAGLGVANKSRCQGLPAMRGPLLLPVKWGLGGPHPNFLNTDRDAGGRADGGAANQKLCQG